MNAYIFIFVARAYVTAYANYYKYITVVQCLHTNIQLSKSSSYSTLVLAFEPVLKPIFKVYAQNSNIVGVLH